MDETPVASLFNWAHFGGGPMQPGCVSEHHRMAIFRSMASQEVVEPRQVDVDVIFQDHYPARVWRQASGLLQSPDLVHPDHQALGTPALGAKQSLRHMPRSALFAGKARETATPSLCPRVPRPCRLLQHDYGPCQEGLAKGPDPKRSSKVGYVVKARRGSGAPSFITTFWDRHSRKPYP